jgi:transposase
MAHIHGHDRSQTLLLPESVDDYVSSDNPVRFIDAIVDRLELVAAGFESGTSPSGHSGLRPWAALESSAAPKQSCAP